MLNHIGIRPYLLVRIARHRSGDGEMVRVTHFVRSGSPSRTVAVVAANLRKEFFSAQNRTVVHVTSCRNRQTAVPDHDLRELVVGHLRRQRLGGQVVVYLLLGTKRCLYLRIFGSILRVDCAVKVEIVVTTVGTGDVGDVPDSVRPCSIHDRSTGEGVRETFRTPLRVVLIVAGGLETAVPESMVQTVFEFAVCRLFLILGDDIFIGNGIEKSRTVHADRVLQLHFVALALEQAVRVAVALVIDVNGGVRHLHLRVAQLVGLAVGELVAVLIRRRLPGHRDLIGIQRRLERCSTEELRHAGEPSYVGLRLRINDHEQRSVTLILGVIGAFGDGGSVRVVRVTVLAGGADIDRSQTMLTSCGVRHEIFLGDVIALRKHCSETCLFGSRCRLTEGHGRGVGRRT